MNSVFENIFNSYSNSSITSVTIFSVLIMAAIMAIYEFAVYRLVSHRTFYNKSFNITISVLPFFIATIILCLQSNLVITLGTIGALAILRFRNSVKDPIDMLYLLWSVFIGIVCGCQLYEVGVCTSIVVTIVLIIFESFDYARRSFVLIARGNNDIEDELNKLFNNKKIKFRIKSRNYSSKGYDYAVEFTYKNIKELNDELSKNENILQYSIIEYDADDIV